MDGESRTSAQLNVWRRAFRDLAAEAVAELLTATQRPAEQEQRSKPRPAA